MKLPLWMAGLMLVGAGLLSWTPAAQDAAQDGVRIGTFDSRALAVAYANSVLFTDSLTDIRQQHEQAKADGDAETMKLIEAGMQARQKKLHGQTFSTAPVDDILDTYPGNLAELARAQGVSVIVSQWDLAWKAEDAPLVDLTLDLVAPYNPNERTMGWIQDLKNVVPLPLDEVMKMDDDH